jgi:hypothetical protein
MDEAILLWRERRRRNRGPQPTRILYVIMDGHTRRRIGDLEVKVRAIICRAIAANFCCRRFKTGGKRPCDRRIGTSESSRTNWFPPKKTRRSRVLLAEPHRDVRIPQTKGASVKRI